MKRQLMNKMLRNYKGAALSACLTLILGSFLATVSYAKTAKEINANVDGVLKRFVKEIKGGKEFLDAAKGILVLPGVVKGGIGVAGEYGEGALRISGKTINYYSISAASFGLTLGGQKKDIVLVFMQEEALKKFRDSAGWKAGVDASVVVVKIGAEGSIDTTKFKEPILGFVFGQKGLMVDASIEGAKLTKLVR